MEHTAKAEDDDRSCFIFNQSEYLLERVYTPGFLGSAHCSPKLVTPKR